VRTHDESNSNPPHMISCRNPSHLVPTHVSLVERSCDNANNVVIVKKSIMSTGVRENDFLVCVKTLDDSQSDVSKMIVEWLEILKLLGRV
jgi:hypothetical protein